MNRHSALDILKVILACMVVGIHGDFLKEVNLLAYQLTVNGLFRIAVPLFLLISGYYFANNIDAPKSWFKRVIILYLFWLVFYVYYWLKAQHTTLDYLSLVFMGYYHLWYLPAMILAALVLFFVRKQSTLIIFILAAALYTTGLFIQFLPHLGYVDPYFRNLVFFINQYNLPLSRNFMFFAFPFFALGYVIKMNNFVCKLSLKKAALVATLSFSGLLAETLYNVSFLPNKESDLLFFLFFLCPFIFIIVMKLKFSFEVKGLTILSSAVYFLHPLLLNLLSKIFGISDYHHNNYGNHNWHANRLIYY